MIVKWLIHKIYRLPLILNAELQALRLRILLTHHEEMHHVRILVVLLLLIDICGAKHEILQPIKYELFARDVVPSFRVMLLAI